METVDFCIDKIRQCKTIARFNKLNNIEITFMPAIFKKKELFTWDEHAYLKRMTYVLIYDGEYPTIELLSKIDTCFKRNRKKEDFSFIKTYRYEGHKDNKYAYVKFFTNSGIEYDNYLRFDKEELKAELLMLIL